MADHLESVKILAKNYRRWRAESDARGDDKMAEVQARRAATLEGLIAEVEELRRATTPIPKSYGDLSDLPPELMKELTGLKVDDLEQQLFNIIKAGDGEVDLDSVLIELFRRYKVLQTRKFLQNKLWRMSQKGVIVTVAGRKGVYATPVENAPAPISSGFDLDDDVPF